MTKSKKAYSLIELSIVIIIISILATGALSAAIYTTNKEKIKVTQERMDVIYDALQTYLVENRRLPCPAPITDVMELEVSYGTASANYGDCAATSGVYESTTAVDVVYGMVPSKTLGLTNEMSQDAFGNKLSYIVHNGFTDDTTNSFGTATATAIITVRESFNAQVTTISEDAIFAVISHGANRSGAFSKNAASQNTRSTDVYEMDNDMDGSNDFDNIIYTSYGGSDIFDDIVFYKTRNDVVMDADELSLIPCAASTIDGYDWPLSFYGEEAVSSTYCAIGSKPKNPTRKCGAFGVWETSTANSCIESAL